MRRGNDGATPSSWMPPNYTKARTGTVDYERLDGRVVVDVKLGAQGIRDLHGGLMQLALLLHEKPNVERACLVIRFPRMTLDSARDAWKRATELLRPDIANRLAVVLVMPDEKELWLDPKSDPIVEEIAHAVSNALRDSSTAERTSFEISRKFFEIWKVLLEAWLSRGDALRVKDLVAMVGCSIPTVMHGIDLLARRGELSGERERGKFALRSFPRQTFEQGAGLADTFRRTLWFADTSGRPEPVALMRRIQRAKPVGIALGGVVGARHLDPHFDLHGTPRIDITLWVPDGSMPNLQFIKNIDPALQQTDSKDTAVLAVHQLSRAVTLFHENPDGSVPFADPVEILLDLYELGFREQFADLIRTLRQEKPV